MITVHLGEAIEDRACTLLGRFTSITATGSTSPLPREGALIKKSDVTSIAAKAYDSTGTLIVSTVPTAADNIYDTIQTGTYWTNLNGGGNFKYLMPATAFPTGATTVSIEVTITQTDSTLATGLWSVVVYPLHQS